MAQALKTVSVGLVNDDPGTGRVVISGNISSPFPTHPSNRKAEMAIPKKEGGNRKIKKGKK
jgi:hypothetical protein